MVDAMYRNPVASIIINSEAFMKIPGTRKKSTVENFYMKLFYSLTHQEYLIITSATFTEHLCL